MSFNRLLNLASIGLLALMIFGLARLGFGVVPVWILAVPFVLLASLDIESCFSRVRTFSARLMPVAFHFVIIATVFAAHQQIGAAGAGGAGCGKRDAGCGGDGKQVGRVGMCSGWVWRRRWRLWCRRLWWLGWRNSHEFRYESEKRLRLWRRQGDSKQQ